MKTKIPILIICSLCVINLHAQFKKKYFLSGGFQASVSNQILTYKSDNGGAYTIKGNQTNIGISAEVGYFFFKNLSASYQLTYQFWEDNLGSRFVRKSVVNGICLNKLFFINEMLYFNFSVTPFYKNYVFKEDVLNEVETINHGVILSSGFNFVINENGLLGVNLFRTLDKLPDTYTENKSGLVVSYKHIFN